MATRTDVESYLRELRDKINFFDVAFRPRGKNLDSLVLLDITPTERLNYLQRLTADNYFSGPNADAYDPTCPDFYEFGIEIKGKEVYIKISLGRPNKRVDCMSFHIAERRIAYPLK